MKATSSTLSATKLGPRLLWPAGVAALFLCASPAYSQSLVDIARQERERKLSQAAHETHVYDNYDLQKAQILLPEDRERAQAAKAKVAPASGVSGEESAVNDAESETETGAAAETAEMPLGDIARRYRAMKAQLQQPDPQIEADENIDDVGAGTYTKSVGGGQESKARPRAFRMKQGTQALAYPAIPQPMLKKPAAEILARGAGIVKKPADLPMMTAAENRSNKRVRAKAGDTLWSMAVKYLGQGKEWPTLARINSQVSNPTRLQVGEWVELPGVVEKVLSHDTRSSASVGLPSGDASRNVRVERGDSLWKVAEQQLGNGSAWSCVARANPAIVDGDLIYPGQVLRVPVSCTDFLTGVRRTKISAKSLSARTAVLAGEVR